MRNRTKKLNSLIEATGYGLQHASKDPIVQAIDGVRNHLRFLPADSHEWSSKISSLASLAHLRRLVSRLSFDKVIDVGANRGQFARSLRQVGYSGNIVSFEPIPSLANALKSEAELDGNWTIIEGAVGNSMERKTFHETSSNDFSSFLEPTDEAIGEFPTMISEESTHEVQIHPLEEWLNIHSIPIPKCMLLKTDTQGYDLEVLKGSISLLNQVSAVLTELSYIPLYKGGASMREVSELLRNHNFSVSAIFPISFSEGALQLIEADGFFVKDGIQC